MDINISISNMLLFLDQPLLPSCYHLIPYNTSFESLQNPMNNGNLDKASLKIIVIDNECLQNRVLIIISGTYRLYCRNITTDNKSCSKAEKVGTIASYDTSKLT
jgi:hypothetical protein